MEIQQVAEQFADYGLKDWYTKNKYPILFSDLFEEIEESIFEDFILSHSLSDHSNFNFEDFSYFLKQYREVRKRNTKLHDEVPY